MAMILPKLILEIPSCEGFASWLNDIPPIDGNSLEKVIKEDFGEAGLERFRSYNVQVNAPVGDNFVLGFDREGPLSKLERDPTTGESKIIGKVYQIFTDKVEEVSAEKADVKYRMDSDKTLCMLKLDLNPENENCRYLRLIFEYRS